MTEARFRVVTSDLNGDHTFRVQRQDAVRFLSFAWGPWRFTDLWGRGIPPRQMASAIGGEIFYETTSFNDAHGKVLQFTQEHDEAVLEHARVKHKRRALRRAARALTKRQWRPTTGDPLVDELERTFRSQQSRFR